MKTFGSKEKTFFCSTFYHCFQEHITLKLFNMKKCVAAITIAIITITVPAHAQKNPEEASVKKVIEEETRDYYEGNYSKWADTWAHDSICYVISSSPSAYYADMGWSKISNDYKAYMKNMPPIDEAEYAKNARKYDYNFDIHGGAAVVTFEEGKGVLETRTLEKDNGSWKITGLASVEVPAYKAKDAFNTIKDFEGKWRLIPSSVNTIPTEKGWQPGPCDITIRLTDTGVEMETDRTDTYNGKVYKSPNEKEELIFNSGSNEIEYIDLQKDFSGNIYTQFGKATSDSIGSFTIRVPYTEKPMATQTIETYILTDDGSVVTHSSTYDINGKQTQFISAKFVRL